MFVFHCAVAAVGTSVELDAEGTLYIYIYVCRCFLHKDEMGSGSCICRSLLTAATEKKRSKSGV
jgi:hypothetical protein